MEGVTGCSPVVAVVVVDVVVVVVFGRARSHSSRTTSSRPPPLDGKFLFLVARVRAAVNRLCESFLKISFRKFHHPPGVCGKGGSVRKSVLGRENKKFEVPTGFSEKKHIPLGGAVLLRVVRGRSARRVHRDLFTVARE